MTGVSFLIDTDWVIDHLNGLGPATRRLQELEPQGLAISIITVAELWEGVLFSRDRQRSERQLRDFVRNVVGIAIDDEICQHFGQIRGTLRKQGKLVGDLDLLTAASALQYNLTLLTNNRRHFEHVAGLRIESLV